MQLVKVRYIQGEDLSSREYTYYSEDALQPGDLVIVPVRDTTGRAQVSAIDVPESEVEAFKDKVKVIPAGSVIEPEEKAVDMVPPSPHLICPDEDAQEPELTYISRPVAVINVKPEDDPRVLALAGEAETLRSIAQSRVISSQADLVPATDDLSVIAKVKKALTEAKADYVKPIKGHLDDVNAAFAKIMIPLEEASQTNRAKLAAFYQESEKRRKEAEEINQQKIELARREAAHNGTGEVTVDTTPVEVPAPVVSKVQTSMGSTSTVQVHKWEVVDLSQVPAQYLMPNSALITQVVKASKGKIVIPGIKVYTEDTIRVNTR